MLPNLIILLFIVALGGTSAWLLRRVWRFKRPLVKWPVSFFTGFLTLLLVLISALVAVGMVRAYASRGNPVVDITVDRTPERIARGEHIANVVCAACHSTDKRVPLAGGKNLSEEIGLPLGNLTPGNLTPAGRISGWSDGEVRRAIREGVSRAERNCTSRPEGNCTTERRGVSIEVSRSMKA